MAHNTRSDPGILDEIRAFFALGIVVLVGYEILTHISGIESGLQKVESAVSTATHQYPPTNVNTATTNKNPGTTSQAPNTKSATTVQQGLITISNVHYGIYGLVPYIAGLLGHFPGGLSGTSVNANACDKVTADVTLVNNTTVDYDVTLYGYIIPAGQPETPANAVGHFWPDNANGIIAGTPYKGIYPGKIVAKSSITTQNVSTAPLNIPNEKFGVLWQVYITGQPSYTSQVFHPLAITDTFTTKPSCPQG